MTRDRCIEIVATTFSGIVALIISVGGAVIVVHFVVKFW